MKPPICEVCNKDAMNENSGLVYFKKTEKDKPWYKRAKKPSFVGHPPNCAWFCETHYPIAKTLKAKKYTLAEALKEIAKE